MLSEGPGASSATHALDSDSSPKAWRKGHVSHSSQHGHSLVNQQPQPSSVP